MSASHPMPPLAQLFTEQVDGVLFVHLVGEVDLSNAEEVQARMMAPLVDASGLVLDLTATSYFDSTGVRMLFRVTEHLRGRSLPLRIVAPPGGHTRRVLELTGVHLRVGLDDDVEAARRAIGVPPGGH